MGKLIVWTVVAVGLVALLSLSYWPPSVFEALAAVPDIPGALMALLTGDRAIGAADTIVPRLEAAGADLNRVEIVSAVRIDGAGRRTFNLQTDIEKLERKITEIGDVALALVVIDPVSSYLGKTDSHKNSEVREQAMADFKARWKR